MSLLSAAALSRSSHQSAYGLVACLGSFFEVLSTADNRGWHQAVSITEDTPSSNSIREYLR